MLPQGAMPLQPNRPTGPADLKTIRHPAGARIQFLLVSEGFYSNRTDFIRTAIRNQLDRHAYVLKKSVTRQTLDLGLRHFTREQLEQVRAAGEQLHVRVLGLLTIAPDLSPKLARATIASLTVLGALHASAEIKAALADRMPQ